MNDNSKGKLKSQLTASQIRQRERKNTPHPKKNKVRPEPKKSSRVILDN